MDRDIETTLASLRSRHLKGIFSKSSEDARDKIMDLIPKDAVVGIGDSTTVAQIEVKEELKKRGTKVLDGYVRNTLYASMKDYEERHYELLRESTMCDIFLTGTNAVTKDGRLVNVDGLGNRVAGMFWGHTVSVIVVGKNKIVKDLEEAFHRIRKVVAPNHVRIRAVELGGGQFETPCAITGKCNDCRVRDRLCNVFTIIEGKPQLTDMNIIIVDEDLGLSWDESWPRERINRIIEGYEEFAWIPPADLPKWLRGSTSTGLPERSAI